MMELDENEKEELGGYATNCVSFENIVSMIDEINPYYMNETDRDRLEQIRDELWEMAAYCSKQFEKIIDGLMEGKQ